MRSTRHPRPQPRGLLSISSAHWRSRPTGAGKPARATAHPPGFRLCQDIAKQSAAMRPHKEARTRGGYAPNHERVLCTLRWKRLRTHVNTCVALQPAPCCHVSGLASSLVVCRLREVMHAGHAPCACTADVTACATLRTARRPSRELRNATNSEASPVRCLLKRPSESVSTAFIEQRSPLRARSTVTRGVRQAALSPARARCRRRLGTCPKVHCSLSLREPQGDSATQHSGCAAARHRGCRSRTASGSSTMKQNRVTYTARPGGITHTVGPACWATLSS